jgi:hypothetical protein
VFVIDQLKQLACVWIPSKEEDGVVTAMWGGESSLQVLLICQEKIFTQSFHAQGKYYQLVYKLRYS